MEILKWTLIFIVSIASVIKFADLFTNASEKIGTHFKIPPFIIGVTIVALGTSLPEIATAVISVMQNHSEMVIGNAVGSNIANILLVLGITAIVAKELKVNKDIMGIDLPIMLGSTILLYITTLDGKFTYIDGTLTLLTLVIYVLYNVKSHRKIEPKVEKDIKEISKEEKKEKLHITQPLIVIGTSIGLYFAADYAITSVVKISEILNIAKELVAISAVALGTSLPELAVSVVAARNGKADLAIGNVTGSNIINALAIMGIPSFIGPLTISPDMIQFAIPTLSIVTILYMFVTMDKTISKWEGMTMVIIYVAFIGKTFNIL